MLLLLLLLLPLMLLPLPLGFVARAAVASSPDSSNRRASCRCGAPDMMAGDSISTGCCCCCCSG
jgi:hypothetical protein